MYTFDQAEYFEPKEQLGAEEGPDFCKYYTNIVVNFLEGRISEMIRPETTRI
jgi:hypothetical protein